MQYLSKLFYGIFILESISLNIFVSSQEMDQDLEQERNEDYSYKDKFGIIINNFRTGSGFKMSTELLTFVGNDSRSLQCGIIYDYETSNVSALNVEHDVFLFKTGKKQNLQSYLFYNFLYRSTRLKASYFAIPEIGTMYNNSRIASIEHHIGMGCKCKLIKNAYLNSSIGYGLYLGSFKKANQPTLDSPTLIGTNGWGWIYKLGIGYNFF